MQQLTLCFCMQGEAVLLAKKKTGLEVGKWTGYGSEVELDEGIKAAAVRGLKEGSGLTAKAEDLKQVGQLHLYFDGILKYECSVYLLNVWEGVPTESAEMHAPRWYALHHLPFGDLWAAGPTWIPLVLNGQSLDASIYLKYDGSMVEGAEGFKYHPTAFI